MSTWDHARLAAGLGDVRIHYLRHSYASALVNQGVSIYKVQTLLGYASIETTKRYAHLAVKRVIQSVKLASTYYSAAMAKDTV